MKKLRPQDKLVAELEKIVKEAQTVIAEYRAATSKRKRTKPVIMIDPRTKRKVGT